MLLQKYAQRLVNVPSVRFILNARKGVRQYSEAVIEGQSLRLSNSLSLAQNASATSDIRTRLLSEVKTAMKNKDLFTSTTLRSILSEVYAADKLSSKISSSAINSIIRKATIRRTDSAAQFIKATRYDLAEKEQREADVLSAFLPPLLGEAEIDHILQEILSENRPQGSDPRKALGQVFRAFYAKVDNSTVDPDLLKRRTERLLTTKID